MCYCPFSCNRFQPGESILQDFDAHTMVAMSVSDEDVGEVLVWDELLNPVRESGGLRNGYGSVDEHCR